MPVRLLAFTIAVLVFTLDRITKYLVREHITAWDTYTVIPGFFNLIHTENPGAAFSLFSNSQSEWRSLFLVGVSMAALALIAALLWRPTGRLGDSETLRIGLALIMGGALGNLFDRVVYGAVTDFLEVYVASFHWPAFNVADSAITVGAAFVLLDLVRSRRPAQQSAPGGSS